MLQIILLLASIIITVVVETVVSLILKIRDIGDLLMIALFNACTNLALNLIFLLINQFVFNELILIIILFLLELVVVIIEAILFNKNLSIKRNYLLISLILNVSSFLVGLLLFNIL